MLCTCRTQSELLLMQPPLLPFPHLPAATMCLIILDLETQVKCIAAAAVMGQFGAL